MTARKIAIATLLVFCVLSVSSLPSVFAITPQNMGPMSMYKVYAVTMTASPKTIAIKQHDNSSSNNCQGFPVCGNGTVQLTMYDKGNTTFTTDGNCLMVVSPSPSTGTGSENLNCSGFPLFHLPAGDEGFVAWTFYIYNWPNGKYKFTFNVDGTVGTSRFVYQSKNVTFYAKVRGGP
jgi:hypothetical protein